MSESRDLFAATADRLFADMVTPAVIEAAESGEFPSDLWAQLEELGLLSILVSEEKGGVGADLQDTAAVLYSAGYHSAPGPIVDTIVGRWLMTEAGLAQSDGSVALIVGTADRRASWLRAGSTVLAVGDSLHLFAPGVDYVAGQDVSGEALDHLGESASASGEFALPDAEDTARRAVAVLRAGQMAGAMAWCVERSVAYVQEREQFGRPLAKLQIVQQYLAQAAGEFVAADMLAGTAAQAGTGKDAELVIAAARTRAAEAADVIAALCHQVHGAIGFSREYALNFRTRRLMAWRDAGLTSVDWARQLGANICGDSQRPWEIITNATLRAGDNSTGGVHQV